MTLLRVVAGEAGPTLHTQRCYLRAPTMADFPAWATLRATSRSFLEPWEPRWPDDDLTRTAFKRRIKRYQREIREDSGYPFFLFRSSDEQLLGGATLSNVRRGVSLSCSLGYWMGEAYSGNGLMGEAVPRLLQFAFRDLRLHRVEAASIPHNERSIRLLEKAGFVREGFARRYLLINGKWQDHVLFAALVEDQVIRPPLMVDPASS
ncbi:putative ribosomal N-acetyltransferase YdaF [Hartmannibacter diazotrophicus]|uniref:Putative ribosomal N-acetyltransferase YdaF n=1 Tax=Hartmannibacter diazotrophicus TaxID=1482074 RepID=A0A2C9D580_9HYPH|nr:GNAT family protein [Hartmannibacter diazotrophicus]SON54665.1 putative ribosomal N-acetyltransferase YdaF [Hartmannibacter diazotrophicus]